MTKRKQLLSTEDATDAPCQLKKPCSDCPWAREAVHGWLGGETPEAWVHAAHGEEKVACHVHPNVQCAGLAIYRGNVCKLPRDQNVLVLPPDRELVFATPNEFLEHHKEVKPKR